MSLGQRLRICMNNKGLTQKDLAELCGIGYQTLNRYLNNKREPDNATIEILAKVLDTSVQYLITGQTIAPDELVDECLLRLKDPKLREVYDKLIQMTPANLDLASKFADLIVTHQQEHNEKEQKK